MLMKDSTKCLIDNARHGGQLIISEPLVRNLPLISGTQLERSSSATALSVRLVLEPGYKTGSR